MRNNQSNNDKKEKRKFKRKCHAQLNILCRHTNFWRDWRLKDIFISTARGRGGGCKWWLGQGWQIDLVTKIILFWHPGNSRHLSLANTTHLSVIEMSQKIFRHSHPDTLKCYSGLDIWLIPHLTTHSHEPQTSEPDTHWEPRVMTRILVIHGSGGGGGLCSVSYMLVNQG